MYQTPAYQIAMRSVFLDHTHTLLFQRWMRAQDALAFRPGGHTPASRAYLDRIMGQLDQAQADHQRLCARAQRLARGTSDEAEADAL